MQWLISPRDDLLWLLGSVLVAWGMFTAWYLGLLSFATLVLIWVFVFHGPHFWATISRTYADKEQFHRRKRLFTQSLVWYLVGPVVVGAGLLLEHFTGRKELWQLFFFLAAMWAFHHVNKQHFGFLALYRAKHKEFNKRDFVYHKYYLLTSLWMPALIMLGTNNAWLKDVPGALSYAGTPGGMANIQAGQEFLHGACTWIFWGAQVIFVGSLIWRVASGKGINLPLLLLILCCVPLTWFVIDFSMASADPFAPFVLVPILTMYHNIQYHGLIWHYNRKKYQAKRSDPAARERLGLATVVNWNILVYFGFGAAFTFLTIGWEQYGLAVMAGGGALATMFKAFFWGFAFHHYYLDSKIWHASSDAELRGILGFPSGKKKPAPAAETAPTVRPEPAVAGGTAASGPITAPSARSVDHVAREATG